MQRCVAGATMRGSTPAPEKTTEEQARAIMCAAQRAVEEEAKRGDDDDGGAEPGLSLKKSLQWFLEGRKNKAMAAAAGGIHRQLEDESASSSKY